MLPLRRTPLAYLAIFLNVLNTSYNGLRKSKIPYQLNKSQILIKMTSDLDIIQHGRLLDIPFSKVIIKKKNIFRYI